MDNKNVDLLEIAKFSEHAHNWWDKQGPYKTLHDINPLRVDFIDRHGQLVGKHVIDVGCGGGILAESMAARGAIVTGIDMSEAALQVAELHRLESQLTIDYRLTTVEQMAEEQPSQYDIVTCLELLEHVPDPVSIVKACATLVKSDGHVFFSTINRNLKAYLYAIVGAEYILKLLPTHTHDFAKFITPAELSAWGRQAGLTPKELTGLSYNILTKHYKLTTDLSVNYLVHMRKR